MTFVTLYRILSSMKPIAGVAVPLAEPSVNRSIERAAGLLGLFTSARPELTLREIEALSGLKKATAHRYATALRDAGLLRFVDGAYALGPRVLELASAAIAGLEVAKLAGSHLDRLVAAAGHTAVLSVWDGEAPIVVRVADNAERFVRIVVATGSRLPADSAQAQVFRAHLAPSPDPALAAVRRRGIARHADVVDGIAAVAAPVFQGDRIVAALAVVATTGAIDEGGLPLVRRLRDAAAAFSQELGSVHRERSDP